MDDPNTVATGADLAAKLLPPILSICTILVTAFVGWLTKTYASKASSDNKSNANQVVQTAFLNGALAAAGRDPSASVKQVAVLAHEHALSAVPDYLKQLGPSVETQNVIATAKATEALAKVAQMQEAQRSLLAGSKTR